MKQKFQINVRDGRSGLKCYFFDFINKINEMKICERKNAWKSVNMVEVMINLMGQVVPYISHYFSFLNLTRWFDECVAVSCIIPSNAFRRLTYFVLVFFSNKLAVIHHVRFIWFESNFCCCCCRCIAVHRCPILIIYFVIGT